MYKETRIIQASEIGFNHKIRITDLVNIIQDVEGAHIESLSALSKSAKEEKFAIILNFRYLRINKWPKYKDMLELTTFPYETRPFYGYRNTIIKDLLGNAVAESYCLGSFINLEHMSPHRLSDYVIKSIGAKEKYPMDYIGRKVDALQQKTFISETNITVQPSHLDYYQHLNNAFYVEFAMNQLPMDFDFQTLVCEYKKAFMLFEKIHLKTYKTNNGFLVEFLGKDEHTHTLIEFLA